MNHRTKFVRALCYYRRTGTLEYDYVKGLIPEKIVDKLTSAELALVMQSIEQAYVDGKNSPKE